MSHCADYIDRHILAIVDRSVFIIALVDDRVFGVGVIIFWVGNRALLISHRPDKHDSMLENSIVIAVVGLSCDIRGAAVNYYMIRIRKTFFF